MKQKTTRLRFDKEELADKKVRRSYAKGEKLADKADDVKEKITKKQKLKTEEDKKKKLSVKLRHGKAEVSTEKLKKPVRRISTADISKFSSMNIDGDGKQDDGAGEQSLKDGTKFLQKSERKASDLHYGSKLRKFKKAEKLDKKAYKQNIKTLQRRHKNTQEYQGSNAYSKWRQKKAIKKEYIKAGHANTTIRSADTMQKAKSIYKKITQTVVNHSHGFLLFGACACVILLLSVMLSSCSVMLQGGANVIIGSSYTAEDQDIKGAEAHYKRLESELKNKVEQLKNKGMQYDETHYDIDEINHNPYELASYLTVKYEDYTEEEVRGELEVLFKKQYELTEKEVVEERTIIENDKEKVIEYKKHYVTLDNHGLRSVIFRTLDHEEKERFNLLMDTKGNRPELFGDDIYANSKGPYTKYDIPGEALTDERFARMIYEAEKYLGYPYVWGGASPETSFDCSGFVSWVINHSGNGWNFGRLTADGLKDICAIIPPDKAEPGDLIFFQGTYDTPGASHVGIYVGNDMMIHCGNPISYESTKLDFWQEHFYCFGRLP